MHDMFGGHGHYTTAAEWNKGGKTMGGKTSTASKLKWAKANRKQFNVQVPIPFFEELTAIIKERGESQYEFLRAACQAAKEGRF